MTHFIFKSKGKPDIYISFDGQDGTSYVSYDKDVFESVELGEARAKQAVAGSKVQKLVTAHGLKFKGKVYKEIDMELVKINNNTQMVTFNIIHPREIFGNETNISFKALKRGPFMATDTSKIITGGETRTTGDADLWAKVKK
jgi:hypothetical protein